ncbi:NAD(P)/FAD-dependent oxidoreductase [Helicobacter sp. MIT 11-5569]|uniref:FAD-dependent oxidoreductase n=1 Tax=Helicobacter sp. MIT 11-5569 TaxID=1548151 RepID=UPI00051FD0E2|nr:FAD-dependent oxidoreductase [Helicobacter sp. MIT 11-5569]TLD83249.1 NAD(P)/FAD-dependent oxidoreductase [Helicobacter sp. MIT 11-5569]
MTTKKVVIIGGSIAGLSAALVLASAIKGELSFELAIIEKGGKEADLYKADVYNVPLFKAGINGEEIIDSTKEQLQKLAKVNFIAGEVTEISGEKGNFMVNGTGFSEKADYVIVATGANACNIKGLESFVKPHTLMPKPGKICLEVGARNVIKDGIYAAGIVSGVTTMVACAMGSATESACAILSDIAGNVAVIHDFKGSR